MKTFKQFRTLKPTTSGWTGMKQTGYGESVNTHLVDNKPHSIDNKPSKVYFSGKQEWHKHGELHNDFGPARKIPETKDKPSSEEYWLKGKQVSKDEHIKHMENLKREQKV